jgi:hypothetical protein
MSLFGINAGGIGQIGDPHILAREEIPPQRCGDRRRKYGIQN